MYCSQGNKMCCKFRNDFNTVLDLGSGLGATEDARSGSEGLRPGSQDLGSGTWDLENKIRPPDV
jgi:hypothetical protein